MSSIKITKPTVPEKQEAMDMLLTRGNALQAMLVSTLEHMQTLTTALAKALKDAEEFDKRFNVPMSKEGQQAALLRSLRAANPAFKTLTDAQLIEKLKNGQVQNNNS